MSKLFVANFSSDCSAIDLQTLFEAHGKVTDCDIIKDYAFVHFADPTEGKAAIQALNNFEFMGSKLKVELSVSRPMNVERNCIHCGKTGHSSNLCSNQSRSQNGPHPHGPQHGQPHGPPHKPPHGPPHGPPDGPPHGPLHGPSHGPPPYGPPFGEPYGPAYGGYPRFDGPPRGGGPMYRGHGFPPPFMGGRPPWHGPFPGDHPPPRWEDLSYCGPPWQGGEFPRPPFPLHGEPFPREDPYFRGEPFPQEHRDKEFLRREGPLPRPDEFPRRDRSPRHSPPRGGGGPAYNDRDDYYRQRPEGGMITERERYPSPPPRDVHHHPSAYDDLRKEERLDSTTAPVYMPPIARERPARREPIKVDALGRPTPDYYEERISRAMKLASAMNGSCSR